MILKILQALIAIPKIGKLITQLMAFIGEMVERGKVKKIEDASIAVRSAKTKEERRAAAKLLKDAISS
ncbi:hypothetical protein GOV11_04320 [Candidatus Woesearchaeota archaeon]|nr:hypothetical protein [Candidatus Woesearchaeota archaeon]